VIEQRYGIIPKSGARPSMVINMRALAYNPDYALEIYYEKK
jgi:hypothetical protein